MNIVAYASLSYPSLPVSLSVWIQHMGPTPWVTLVNIAFSVWFIVDNENLLLLPLYIRYQSRHPVAIPR